MGGRFAYVLCRCAVCFCWRLAEWKLLLGLEAVEDTPAGFSEAIGVD